MEGHPHKGGAPCPPFPTAEELALAPRLRRMDVRRPLVNEGESGLGWPSAPPAVLPNASAQPPSLPALWQIALSQTRLDPARHNGARSTAPAELMAALPDVAPGAGAAALVDADGWMAVGPKGLRQRSSAGAAVEMEADGAAAAGGRPGGFALLEGLRDEEMEEEEEEGEAMLLEEEEEALDEEEVGAMEEPGCAAGSTGSAAGRGPPTSALSLPGRRKRLLDDSILRCPHRSLIADVMALHRRRAAAGPGGHGGGASARDDAMKASAAGRPAALLLQLLTWMIPAFGMPTRPWPLSAHPLCSQGASDHRQVPAAGASAGRLFDMLPPDSLAHVLTRMEAR